MALIPTPCTPSDAPACAEAYIAAFSPSPRHKVTYGNIPHSDQIQLFTKKFGKDIELHTLATPTQEKYYLKVVDPTTGELMAFAIWVYLPDGYRAEEDWFANVEEVPVGANERFLRDFAGMTGWVRGEHEGRKRGKAHWLLSMLGTHPKHERKGAAAALIGWPFAQADRDGKRCYVESSVVAYDLYKRCGFSEDVGEIVVDLDKYSDQGFGVARWVAMMREPQIRGSPEG
ncbi:hypothetical protein ACLMJK_003008 [Lecanora helva]